MGYDLHITRREQWSDEGDDITFDEFVRYVKGDSSFTYPGQSGEAYADWRCPTSDYESWLCWSDGQIQTKNPEPELIDKMVAVARDLRGKAQGDDGEVYLSATEIQQEEAQRPASSMPVAVPAVPAFFTWPLWKQMLAAFLAGCILLALKLLIFG